MFSDSTIWEIPEEEEKHQLVDPALVAVSSTSPTHTPLSKQAWSSSSVPAAGNAVYINKLIF